MGNIANYMGAERDHDRNVSMITCWGNLPFGYKFWIITTWIAFACQIILPMFGIVSNQIFAFEVSKPQYVYTFFTSSFFQFSLIFGIIDLLFVFLFLLQTFPEMEKRLSTIFILLDPIFHGILLNTCTFVVSWIISFEFPVLYQMIYGTWWPLLVIYSFINNYRNPNEKTRFCCCPFLIQRRYIPWLLAFLATLLIGRGAFALQFAIAIIIGYIQGAKIYKHIIRIPISVYFKLDSLMPNFIKSRSDYVKAKDVSNQLRFFSLNCNGQDDKPIPNNVGAINAKQLASQNIGKVEVLGKGVAIGSSSAQQPSNARSVWLKKAQQIQIQPQIKQQQNNVQVVQENIFGAKQKIKEAIDNKNGQIIITDENASKYSNYNLFNEQQVPDQDENEKEKQKR